MELDNSISNDAIQIKTVTRIGLRPIKQDISGDTSLGHGFELRILGKKISGEKIK